MESVYLCPDCRAEHAEPGDAVLGHLARCLGCVMLLELLDEERMLNERLIEIRLAA